MLICPIVAFRILRSFEIVKWVQHMLAWGWHVHQWTHRAKMAELFVLVTSNRTVCCIRASYVIKAPHVPQHLRISHALFILPGVFFLWLSKHVWLLKCLLHRLHGILSPADIQGHSIVTTCLYGGVFRAICTALITALANESFGHGTSG
jgi:hypothetical protein